ncbi:MAG: GH1 family beta-glucosidase [Balneolales bacterium]
MPYTKLFPADFLFGAATSSFQIEGHPLVDGAGPSIWTDFIQRKGAILNGDHANLACNHYELWEQDIELMKQLGLKAYRLSISWPRIMPEGEGEINQKGLDFYSNIIDKLIEAGIKPMVTLYHWDLPQALQDKGGWTNPGIIDAFAHYSVVMNKALGDRVTDWITLNEPWVFMHLGMISGIHAPGIKDLGYAAKAYKNILLASSKAISRMRSVNPDHMLGVTCDFTKFDADSDSPADIMAMNKLHDYHNNLFVEPWFKGTIPESANTLFGPHGMKWSDDELTNLVVPIDFLGVNYYRRNVAVAAKDGFLDAQTLPPEGIVTEMDWQVYPDGLYDVLKWVYDTCKVPLYVTENGSAYDYPVVDGRVEDQLRTDYLKSHLEACAKAIRDGVDLRGYYAWSLLDNFEWERGYSKRFGMIHVDYETLERTIKDSGYCYRDLIRKHQAISSKAKNGKTVNDKIEAA